MSKEIDIDNLPQNIKDKIIKDHMSKYYHWTVGLLSFIIGTFFGILIK
jgi:hypothetical protein